jgi:catecholate siderophore receptor
MTASKGKVLRPASLRTATAKGPAATAGLGVAVGLSAIALMPAHALAQDAERLATVKVQDTAIESNPNAEAGVPYKARTSGDERHTRPLAETPQTITVVTKAAIEDSGNTDLSKILDAQPGVTVGTGENGNAFGDRYIIRGQDARSDTFVDGLRDPGMTIRESFAVEQIEITKGPNSSFAGRGSSGGAINAITKQATTFLNFANVKAAAGTDDHVRVTGDINHAFSDTFAIRANALYAYEEVPDRGPADRERKGAALSAFFTPTDAFEATLDYYGLRAEDNPDVGSYLVAGKPASPIPPAYAQKEDFLKSDVDTFTARLKYKFNENVRLTSLTRYGSSDNGYVISGGHAGTTGANNPGGVYATTTISDHQGWQEVRYFANQENLFFNTELFGKKNEFIASFEYTDNKVTNGIYRLTKTGAPNCVTGTGTVLNNYCVTGKDGKLVADGNNLLKRTIVKGPMDQDWQVKTVSASIMDTVDLTDRLTVFAGLRYDKFDFDLGIQNTTTLVTTPYSYSDDLWNGHVGVTFKLNDAAMVYATYASAADINGGESDVGTSSGYGGAIIFNGSIAAAKPERSKSYELGLKVNVMEEKLLLTAAAFRVDKTGVMEGADYNSVGTFNSGANRVEGLEFSATGAVTDKLTLQAGATFMDSEITKSATATNFGRALANFANTSATAQAKYQFNDKFSLGGVVKYKSKRYGGQPDTAAPVNAQGAYSQVVPAYTTVDLFGAYRFNSKLEARVNVNNVTDKDYYLAVYRGGFFLYKGDARNVRFTLNYDF